MRLTIIGKSPAWSDAGGACSGYLIEQGDTAVLLDCGNGVLGKLRERIHFRAVNAVVVSHLHGDHTLDLVPFSYALKYGPGSVGDGIKPRLIAPAGAGAFFNRLDGTWDDEGLITGAFELSEYEPESEIPLGDLALRTHPVPHIGATHALEVTGPSGSRLVFGADGRYSSELIEAARGADLLISEATLPKPDESQSVHMSAEEAGKLAREAAVGRLVLTHISADLDTDRSRELAAEAFGGEVEVAREFATYDI